MLSTGQAIYSEAPPKAALIRIRLGPWSGWLYPLFTWQISPRLGLAPADLQPIERIGAVTAPVFVIGGGADRHTPPAETVRLFAAAPEPKRLWLVPGAVHGDLYAAAPQEYQRQVLAFCANILCRPRRYEMAGVCRKN